MTRTAVATLRSAVATFSCSAWSMALRALPRLATACIAVTWVPLVLAQLDSSPTVRAQLEASRVAAAGPMRAAGAPPLAGAVTGAHRVGHLTAELVADRTSIRPGERWRLGLRLAHDPGWHTYWRNPGDSGLATQFDPIGPDGTTYGPIVWPAPQRIALGPLANYGYEDDTILARDVTLPADWQGTSPARFEVQAQWLVCRDVCIPGTARLAIAIPVTTDRSDRRIQSNSAGAAVSDRASVNAGADPGADSNDDRASPWRSAFDAAASRAPDPTRALRADAVTGEGRLRIALPATLRPGQAEFFPYFERVITPAAEQRLLGAGPADLSARSQLSLKLLDDAPSLAEVESGLAGLLVADGQALELQLTPVASLPAAGQELSVAQAKQPAAVTAGTAQSPSGSALGSLVQSTPSLSAPSPIAPSSSALSPNALSPSAPSSSAPSAGAPSLSAPTASPAGSDAGPAKAQVGFAVGAAVLGGLLLNLMPCVFPVIGLKILSFAGQTGSHRMRRQHASVFALGVVLSLVFLGGLLLLLRGLGQAAGWGFQLQSPLFVALMALLFLLIALNLFGVFEVGARLTTIEGGGSSTLGQFFAGVLAVLVATPCTAPFMGAAIGFTLAAGVLETLAIFFALGIGMALPYLLFGFVPALLRLLPRPGPWLEGLRQFLGFPMLATAIWLTWVLMRQTGPDGGLRLLVAAVLLAFAGWLYGRLQRQGRSVGHSWVAVVVLVLTVGATAWQLRDIEVLAATMARTASSAGTARGAAAVNGTAGDAGLGEGGAATELTWQPWSPAAVAAARAASRPVFVDFTAAWCISCQANKKLVLERDSVRHLFATTGVVTLRADWTRADPAITAELARHGRNGVPLYLFYPAGAPAPRILPELLTIDSLKLALGESPEPEHARQPPRAGLVP